MKLKLNDKTDKTGDQKTPADQKTPVDQKTPDGQVTILVEDNTPPVDTLGSLCCELGCQLSKIVFLSLVVSTFCFFFGLIFYHVVLANYGL